MTTEEVNKLSSNVTDLRYLEHAIRNLKTHSLTVYSNGSYIEFKRIPDLNNKVANMLISELEQYYQELVTKMNDLVICTAQTKTTFKPVEL